MAKKTSENEGLIPQITVKDKSALAKLQRQFNSKIKKINTLKASLEEAEQALQVARQRLHKELQPLLDKLLEARIAFVKLLDRSYALPYFRKKEKEKIGFLIGDLAYDLISQHGVEELTEIHDRYTEKTHAEYEAEADEMAKGMAHSMFKDIFGLDLDFDNLDDLEKVQAQIEQQMEEKQQAHQTRRAGRKKTPAQLEKEAKAKAEMANISKASRRIYTDLVKLLHPDKEQDPTARAWKEEAIKKVTLAYEQDDFFELLRMQMEFIEEQDRGLDLLSEQQLKYYIKMLNDQIRELEDEQFSRTGGFGPGADFYYRYCGNPKQMDQKFAREKRELKKELTQLQQDLQELESPKSLREFLKGVEIDEPEDDFW
ncbi:J domain-containing protein [soil metagenome]